MRLPVMQRTVLPRPFCLSVGQTRVLRQNERKFCHILTPHERTFILVFWQEEWFLGGDPYYLKFWGKLTLLERKLRFKGISQRKTVVFVYNCTATTFLCGNTVSNKVVRHLLDYLSVQKLMMGDVRLKVNFLVKVSPSLSARANASQADEQRNTTHILFASQRLQCSIKFITTLIN